MEDPIKSFGGVATGLARNPLGIIALFIVLVYGFASLVTLFADKLVPQERILLVGFMITFPVLVLAIFTWLVTSHSSALFAPSDFQTDDTYLAALKMRRDSRYLEQELNVQAAAMIDGAEKQPGNISTEQIRSAARVKVQAGGLDEDTLRGQLQQLCIEYETIRRVLPPGRERTRAMTEVLLKMRTLGPAVAGFLPELKASTSPGKRLAAVAIMQLEPDKADIRWLLGRFTQDKPFIFYHAAVALDKIAQQGDEARRAEAREAAKTALRTLEGFEGGQKDANSIAILARIAAESPGANVEAMWPAQAAAGQDSE
jgi:hypothetical protein